MAHPQQMNFVSNVKSFLPDYFKGRKVLEIGSLDINGSVRQFFEGCHYLGLDVGEGRGVDLVCPGQDYGGLAGDFDVVISCEAMEHNSAWRETWLNMLRLMRSDGLMVMTCATAGRKQHGTAECNPLESPLTLARGENYYRNLVADDFRGIVRHEGWFAQHAFFTDPENHDLCFFGVGRDAREAMVKQADALAKGFEKFYFEKNVLGKR